MLRLAALLILLPSLAFAQAKDHLPSGKQYLAGQLAASEVKVADMLDEIATLRKQLEAMREMLRLREEKKAQP